MVTATDDLSERMTAVETGLVELRGEMQANHRETNARMTAVETAVSELREYQRATNALIISLQQSMIDGVTARIDALQQSMDTRIDLVTARIDTLQQSVNSRIDRLFYAIVGGSAAMMIATVSALLTLVLTLD